MKNKVYPTIGMNTDGGLTWGIGMNLQELFDKLKKKKSMNKKAILLGALQLKTAKLWDPDELLENVESSDHAVLNGMKPESVNIMAKTAPAYMSFLHVMKTNPEQAQFIHNKLKMLTDQKQKVINNAGKKNQYVELGMEPAIRDKAHDAISDKYPDLHMELGGNLAYDPTSEKQRINSKTVNYMDHTGQQAHLQAMADKKNKSQSWLSKTFTGEHTTDSIFAGMTYAQQSKIHHLIKSRLYTVRAPHANINHINKIHSSNKKDEIYHGQG